MAERARGVANPARNVRAGVSRLCPAERVSRSGAAGTSAGMAKTHESRGIADLMADTRTLTERLVKLEIERARAGFQKAAARAASGAGLLGAGAVFALIAVGTLTAAAVLGLATAMPAWAASLIVAAVALVLAALLILLGSARVRSATATAPDEVVTPIKEDARWLAHESRQTSNGTSK